MEKTKLLLIILLSVSILVAGCSRTEIAADNDDGEDEKLATDDINKASEAELLSGKQAKYYTFTQEAYEQALKENKIILLYFYANWCPICRVEQPSTKAAFDELSNENIIGFRVNYKDSDTDMDEQALAKEFQIPYQHTKVIIKDGKQVLKAPDSWNKARYIEELEKVA